MNFRNVILAILCIAAAACYKQMPLSTVPPVPATRIVATLTDSGTLAMGNALGPGALEIEGVVSAANEAQWTLQMIRVDHRGGQTAMWNHEPVLFSPKLLANPTVVVFDRKRSWLAAGGVVVGAILIAKSFNLIGGEESAPIEQPPERTVVPAILRIRR